MRQPSDTERLADDEHDARRTLLDAEERYVEALREKLVTSERATEASAAAAQATNEAREAAVAFRAAFNEVYGVGLPDSPSYYTDQRP